MVGPPSPATEGFPLKHLYCLLPILSLLTGCTAVGTTGTPPSSEAHSRALQAPYQTLWSRTLLWLGENRIGVGSADQGAGLITGRFGPDAVPGGLDCGDPVGSQGVYQARFEGGEGRIEVVFRRGIDASTDVAVRVSGEREVVIRNVFGGVLQRTTASCGGSGLLEQRLLGFLERG